MIRNIERYKKKQSEDRKKMLKELTVRKRVEILESLLRIRHSFPKRKRALPIALAKLIQPHR